MPPTSELMGRMAHRRAVEAVIWGMPAVNADLMFQAMARAVRGDWNQVVYWSRLGGKERLPIVRASRRRPSVRRFPVRASAPRGCMPGPLE